MDFIPIEPDENLESILDSVGSFPFSLVDINQPGDYENENVVLRANEDIDSLSDYIFTYSIEDTATGIPDYDKCRFLTFDDIALQKGDLLQIYTRRGKDTTAIGFDTGDLYKVMYWGLSAPIWHCPHSSFEIIERGDSYSAGLSQSGPDRSDI